MKLVGRNSGQQPGPQRHGTGAGRLSLPQEEEKAFCGEKPQFVVTWLGSPEKLTQARMGTMWSVKCGLDLASGTGPSWTCCQRRTHGCVPRQARPTPPSACSWSSHIISRKSRRQLDVFAMPDEQGHHCTLRGTANKGRVASPLQHPTRTLPSRVSGGLGPVSDACREVTQVRRMAPLLVGAGRWPQPTSSSALERPAIAAHPVPPSLALGPALFILSEAVLLGAALR